MSVAIDTSRKAVVLTWDTSVVKGDEAHVKCVNSEDGSDISTFDTDNDGVATVSFPADYTGSADVTVTGSDEGEDTGTISV